MPTSMQQYMTTGNPSQPGSGYRPSGGGGADLMGPGGRQWDELMRLKSGGSPSASPQPAMTTGNPRVPGYGGTPFEWWNAQGQGEPIPIHGGNGKPPGMYYPGGVSPTTPATGATTPPTGPSDPPPSTQAGNTVQPDVDYNQLIADRPEVLTGGLDRLRESYDSGSLNVTPAAWNDDKYKGTFDFFMGQGRSSGLRAGNDLVAREGAGAKARGSLFELIGTSQGAQTGFGAAQQQAAFDTGVAENNANRGLSALGTMISGDLATTDAQRARHNDTLGFLQDARDERLAQHGMFMDNENNRLNWAGFGLEEKKLWLQEELQKHGIEMDNKQFDLLMQEFALKKEMQGMTIEQMKEQLRSLKFTNDQADKMAALLDEYMDLRNRPPVSGSWATGQTGAWKHQLAGMADILQGAGMIGGGQGISGADMGNYLNRRLG